MNPTLESWEAMLVLENLKRPNGAINVFFYGNSRVGQKYDQHF